MNNVIGSVIIIWFVLGAIAAVILSSKHHDLHCLGSSTPKGVIPIEVVFFLFFLYPSQAKILNNARQKILDRWIKADKEYS